MVRSLKALRHKAVFGSAAGLCLIIAGGFFSAAAWIVLAQFSSALIATTVLGCIYAGLAAVFAAKALGEPVQSAPSQTPLAAQSPAIIQAFFEGMAHGRQARRDAS